MSERDHDTNRQLWMAVRRGLLVIVKAIEDMFGLRQTEDIDE